MSKIKLEVPEIREFLYEKPGYCKEGGKRLKKVLDNKGFYATEEDCKEAIRLANSYNNQFRTKLVTGKSKILIYDIETSPNIGWFWRAGYKQDITYQQIIQERAIICISYKWYGEDQIFNLAWDKEQNDSFIIEQFVNVMNEADLLVAHNGDNFDLKWLRTRALIHNIKMLPNYKQFDTLKIARGKLLFNSNRLDYISKVLGFEGKKSTTVDLWKDVVFKNDRFALKEMLDYCDEDVRQLEKVFHELQYVENPVVHAGTLEGQVKQTSPINGSFDIEHVKAVSSSRGTLKHIMKDKETDRMFEMSDTNYKKFLLITEDLDEGEG